MLCRWEEAAYIYYSNKYLRLLFYEHLFFIPPLYTLALLSLSSSSFFSPSHRSLALSLSLSFSLSLSLSLSKPFTLPHYHHRRPPTTPHHHRPSQYWCLSSITIILLHHFSLLYLSLSLSFSLDCVLLYHCHQRRKFWMFILHICLLPSLWTQPSPLSLSPRHHYRCRSSITTTVHFCLFFCCIFANFSLDMRVFWFVHHQLRMFLVHF